jgi:hypothetical protein
MQRCVRREELKRQHGGDESMAGQGRKHPSLSPVFGNTGAAVRITRTRTLLNDPFLIDTRLSSSRVRTLVL